MLFLNRDSLNSFFLLLSCLTHSLTLKGVTFLLNVGKFIIDYRALHIIRITLHSHHCENVKIQIQITFCFMVRIQKLGEFSLSYSSEHFGFTVSFTVSYVVSFVWVWNVVTHTKASTYSKAVKNVKENNRTKRRVKKAAYGINEEIFCALYQMFRVEQI